ncbi:MAG: efflux RND transporter periplasmic adaptor subunit [Hyphomicrobiaceae bacterium]
MKPLPVRVQIIVLIAMIASAGALWLGRDSVKALVGVESDTKPGKRAQRRSRGGIPVIVAKVTEARNDETIAAVGTARARRSVMLYAKSDGVITAFLPKAGDRLNAGETIFELDARQAELAAEIAQKRAAESRRLLERARQLQRRRVNSPARVVDAEVAADRAELVLLQAKKVLSDLRIVAPFDGIIGLPKVETGDRVTSTTPIASFDMRAELLVEFEIPEKYSAKIRSGDQITAVTPSYGSKSFAGRVEYLDSRIDPTSRTVKVRAVIPNKSDLLRPGMSFAVEIALAGGSYAVVPELSVQWRKGESYVWRVRGSKVDKSLVSTIQRRNDVVLVSGDVAPGDLVVVEGVQRLRPGRKVLYKAPDRPAKPDVTPKRSAGERRGGKG